MFTETARAKINLNLHVAGLAQDPSHKYFGYHPLSSLVVFADYGDELSCEISEQTTLEISGPFSKGLETDNSNLILKAYRAASEKTELPPLKFHLVKNLPIASGIGGGSADAAAALRLLKKYTELPDSDWLAFALSLGADVPVCFHSKTSIMRGIGEIIDFQPSLGNLPALLINPGKSVRTGEIFRIFDAHAADNKLDQPEIIGALENALFGRNDLSNHAKSVVPEIRDVIKALISCMGCQVARLSGSGATCFGVFANRETQNEAYDSLKSLYPDWWIQPVRLGDPG